MTRGSTATERLAEAPCPYLRAEEASARGEVAAVTDLAGPQAICAAGNDAYRPGTRQQGLFCLSPRHPSCPRFPAADRRAAERAAAALPGPAPWAAAADADATSDDRPRGRRPSARAVPLPTAIAGVVLVLALVAAFAFTAARGGIDLAAAPAGTASPSPTVPAAAVESWAPTPGPTAATPGPAATSSPASSPTASPTPVSTAPATAVPSASPSPAATTPADPRYAGLKPCPGRPDCFLYVVRRGDTLSSIAAAFGIPLRTIRALNPEIVNPSVIHVGQRIRIPGPS